MVRWRCRRSLLSWRSLDLAIATDTIESSRARQPCRPWAIGPALMEPRVYLRLRAAALFRVALVSPSVAKYAHRVAISPHSRFQALLIANYGHGAMISGPAAHPTPFVCYRCAGVARVSTASIFECTPPGEWVVQNTVAYFWLRELCLLLPAPIRSGGAMQCIALLTRSPSATLMSPNIRDYRRSCL